MKKIISLFILTACSALSSRADFTTKPKNNVWTLNVSTGIAILTSEVTNKFQFLENEFRHQPGWAFNLNFGRTIGNHWEPGITLGMYKLSGISESAGFSGNGVHASLMDLYPGIPVEYDNISASLSFFIRYHFKEFSNIQLNRVRFDPYAEIGAGLNIFATELYYQSTPPDRESAVIFQKSGPNKGNVGQVCFGVGTSIGFGSRWKLTLTLNSDVVNYDCLDGVHNYDDSGNRNDAHDLVTRLMVGLNIPIGKAPEINIIPQQEPFPWRP